MKKIFYFFLVHLSAPLGKLIYYLVRIERPSFLVQFFIRFIFINKLKVDARETEKPLKEYKSFLSFFTRKLQPTARSINANKNIMISPVDAEIIASGSIINNQLIQIKNKTYFLKDLITEAKISPKTISQFEKGKFINLYLAPKDYHLIHHPYPAKIKKVTYIPGELYPVNNFSLLHFDKVFARNRRVAIEYETSHFSFIMVLVGAFNVGRIPLFFDKDFYRYHSLNKVKQKSYRLSVEKGSYAAGFELGSSVVMLFPSNVNFSFKSTIIKMGQPLIKILS